MENMTTCMKKNFENLGKYDKLLIKELWKNWKSENCFQQQPKPNHIIKNLTNGNMIIFSHS